MCLSLSLSSLSFLFPSLSSSLFFLLLPLVCDNNTCGGKGTCNNNECTCQRTYSGKFCQYKGTSIKILFIFIFLFFFTDDCVDDSDCGGSAKGACIDIQGTSRPMKQCFCNPGWQGPACGNGKSIVTYNHYTLYLFPCSFYA